ncbi:MAG: acyl-CoA dehydrogenase family protein [Ardenticatenaceae bacterium]|nr:acyl-CoA dehydrogenase family protein [Ardenticatenaceae bacterium]
MIDFQIPEKLLNELKMTEMVAAQVMRPHARYYDEHEHERPKEFINMMWPVMREQNKAQLERRRANGSAPKREGPNLTLLRMVLLIEMLSWGDAGQYLCLPGGGLGGFAVEAAGTPEQKVKFMTRFAEGSAPVWGSMAITEPDAGSDNSSMRTTAVLDSDTNEWILNGEKIFITNGALSLAESEGFCVVWATVDPTAGRKGIKSFVVDAHTPGVSVSPGLDKLGIRASDTVVISFQDARVPFEHMLGGVETQDKASSKGFQGAMQTFDASRPAVAASAVGIARAALEFTKQTLAEDGIVVDYTKPRHQMTAVERDLIEMEAQYKTAWLLTLKASEALMYGRGNRLEASMCKAHAGTAVTRITQKSVELLGPLGYSREMLAEKFMRDAKINDIYEGTRQINLLIVARAILGYSRKELK